MQTERVTIKIEIPIDLEFAHEKPDPAQIARTIQSVLNSNNALRRVLDAALLRCTERAVSRRIGEWSAQ